MLVRRRKLSGLLKRDRVRGSRFDPARGRIGPVVRQMAYPFDFVTSAAKRRTVGQAHAGHCVCINAVG